MNGVGRDVTLLAAFAAPTVGAHRAGAFELIRPPADLRIVADPEGPYRNAHEVAKRKKALVDAIVKVLQSQGALVARETIEPLVSISTWNERCFEFEHFTDPELVQGLRSIHDTCDGLSDAGILDELARC